MTSFYKNLGIKCSDLLELAKCCNIKGAGSNIEKAVGVVSNYDHCAELVGVSGYWSQQIKEETGYRMENISDILYYIGLGK